MLRKLGLLLMIFSLGFLLTSAYADMDDAWAVGKDSSGEYYWRINSTGTLLPGTDSQNDIGDSTHQVEDVYIDGVLTYSTSASIKYPYAVVATGDSLAATKSGGSYIVTSLNGSGGKITLPAAVGGLKYSIIDAEKSSSAFTFSVDPNGTDQIVYLSLDAGDKITSPSTTGDSVTLVCGATGYWYIEDMHGTWTDGGA